MHLQIARLIDEEAAVLVLEMKQDALDRHDDKITGLTIHLQKIIAKCVALTLLLAGKCLHTSSLT